MINLDSLRIEILNIFNSVIHYIPSQDANVYITDELYNKYENLDNISVEFEERGEEIYYHIITIDNKYKFEISNLDIIDHFEKTVLKI